MFFNLIGCLWFFWSVEGGVGWGDVISCLEVVIGEIVGMRIDIDNCVFDGDNCDDVCGELGWVGYLVIEFM